MQQVEPKVDNGHKRCLHSNTRLHPAPSNAVDIRMIATRVLATALVSTFTCRSVQLNNNDVNCESPILGNLA